MGEKTEFTIIIDGKLQEDIAEKIAETARTSWNYSVAEAINKAILDKLKEKDFVNKVAEKVAQKISFNEDEFMGTLIGEVKPAFEKTLKTLIEEVLKKTDEKIKSYGFIQIGR